MANRRGGYREPSGGPRASGIGKNSQRSDAAQPIDVPNVQDSTDLVQGDRQKLEAAQRVQRIGRAGQPRLAPAGQAPAVRNGSPIDLPKHLFEMPSARPNEPETEGLPFGPGAGPESLAPEPPEDDREVVLRFLAAQPNAPQAIVDMADEMRASRRAPEPPMEVETPYADELSETEPGIGQEPVEEEIEEPATEVSEEEEAEGAVLEPVPEEVAT